MLDLWVKISVDRMKQDFNVIRIETSRDMGIGNRKAVWERIPDKDLVAGNVYKFHGNDLTVVSLDENRMVFTYMSKTITLDKSWQVIGTPEFTMPNERISVDGRCVFFFSKDKDVVEEWSDSHAGELVDRMNEHTQAGELWKNIPLVRELIHEFKDVAPFRSATINPVYKAHYIACILENDYVVKRETPRLYQSLCELYRIYRDFELVSDFDEYLQENFDKYYFRQIDRWIYHFAWISNNPTSEVALNSWKLLGGMLKVDPVQATQQWEDVIYEVEKEVDEQLKDEPRGMGFCFGYWSAKKAALARRGIEWKSPSAMNPGVMFD